MNVEKMIIDSSVALKWYLPGEDNADDADRLAVDFFNGRAELFVPTLFDYEIINVIKVAVARNRISDLEAQSAIARFQALKIHRRSFFPLQNRTFRLAVSYQRSVYDAAYLALAETLGLDFYTGDKRLFNAVNSIFPWVKWIGDYPV